MLLIEKTLCVCVCDFLKKQPAKVAAWKAQGKNRKMDKAKVWMWVIPSA